MKKSANEPTQQNLLSESHFIHRDPHHLLVELFNADLFGYLRQVQGFVRSCTKEIILSGHEGASGRIAEAIATARRYNRYHAAARS